MLRTKEIDLVSDWIRDDSCRLIAIMGPSGIGKTWLIEEAKKSSSQKSTRWIEPLDGKIMNIELPAKRFNRDLLEKLGDATLTGTVFANAQHEFLAPQFAHGIDYVTLIKAIVVFVPVVRSFRSKAKVDSIGNDKVDKIVKNLQQISKHKSCVIVLDPYDAVDFSNNLFLNHMKGESFRSVTVVFTPRGIAQYGRTLGSVVSQTLELVPLSVDDLRLLVEEIGESDVRSESELRDIVETSNGITREILAILSEDYSGSASPGPRTLSDAMSRITSGLSSTEQTEVETGLLWICNNLNGEVIAADEKWAVLDLLVEAWTFLSHQPEISPSTQGLMNQCSLLSMEIHSLLAFKSRNLS
jgi:hypothetical protein